MKNTKLAVLLLASVAMLCIAATDSPTNGAWIFVASAGTNSPSVNTNVPIHVLPVVQQPEPVSSQLAVLVIPILVPVLLDYAKKTFPQLPSWSIPSLAPFLGAVGDLCLQAAGTQTGGTIKGAALGLAGVGLREVVNQLKQIKQPPPPLIAQPVQAGGTEPVANPAPKA